MSPVDILFVVKPVPAVAVPEITVSPNDAPPVTGAIKTPTMAIPARTLVVVDPARSASAAGSSSI